ncbi:MAG: DUF1294 domain-containing protein [Symploca sp. SIO2E6]|nr:DUF1294 domain-containing protein [Symploca sp. SIO2E6]
MIEIITGVFSLVFVIFVLFVALILWGTSLKIYYWTLNWIRKISPYILLIFALFLCVNLTLNILFDFIYYEILPKKSSYTNQNFSLLIWIFARCILIFILYVFAQGKNKLVKYADNSLKQAKNNKDDVNIESYQEEKASHQTWFFILYSIIIFVTIWCLTPILLFEIEHLLQYFFQSNSNYIKFFGTTFIVFLGLIFLCQVKKHNNPTFRACGQCIVIMNTSVIALLTFCFFNQHNYNFALLSVFEFYFKCVNMSAFLSYGYDSSIAWLFPKSEEPIHWLQRLFESLDLKYKIKKYMPRIPEPILHWHSACGGTIGAYCGHLFFKHKMRGQESKRKFAPIFGGTALTQILMLIGYQLKAGHFI